MKTRGPASTQAHAQMTAEDYDVYHEELATSEGMRESPDAPAPPRRSAGTEPGAGTEPT